MNETIQKIQVLGFNNGTVAQQQVMTGRSVMHPNDPAYEPQNAFQYAHTDYNYRTVANPIALVDKSKFSHFFLFANIGLLVSARLILKRNCDKNDFH